MSNHRCRHHMLSLAIASCGSGLGSPEGRAADVSWINPAGGSFAVAANWGGGVVPTTTDRPVFNLNSAGYTVAFGPIVATTITDGLFVRTDRVTLDLNHFAYRLGPTTSAEPGVAFIAAVAGEDATLHVLDGGVVCGSATVGAATLSSGSLANGNLSIGTAALWTSTRRTSIRNGRLDVEHGGRFATGTNVSTPNTGWFTIGVEGGSATARVSGIGSQIEDHTSVFIGQTGQGTLIIENGGRFTGFGAQVGFVGIGNVLVRGPGSLWSAAYRGIGSREPGSSGHVTISDRALVRQIGPDGDRIEGVTNPNASAQVTVHDPGSRYELDASLSVGRVGGGNLTVLNGGVVDAGSMTVGAEVDSPSPSTVWIDGDGALVNVRGDMTVGLFAPQGRVELYNGAAMHVGGRLTVNASGTVFVRSDHVQAATLDVRGGMVRLHDAAGAAIRVGAISVVNGGTVNLSRGGMVVDYSGSTPIAAVAALIRSAYDGGTWAGPGITSSSAVESQSALGFAEASALGGVPAFFGAVDDHAVLVRYTRTGDANLDGRVNLQDFNRLAANFGLSDLFWHHGDFNYDGNVNLIDFNRLASNFGLSAGPDAFVDPADWAALAAAVPEPSAGAIVALLARRPARRRRRF